MAYPEFFADHALRRQERKVKKHSRKSVDWHKRRFLARFHPPTKDHRVEIVQTVIAHNTSILLLYVYNKKAQQSDPKRAHKHFVQEHYRIVRALRYLVAEGQVHTDMPTEEWDVQLALGTAEARRFFIK